MQLVGRPLSMAKRTKPYLLHASIRPDADVDYDSYLRRLEQLLQDDADA